MADSLDVITLDAARAATNRESGSIDDDGVLEGFVTAVSRRFDQLIGPVVQREVVELHDGGCGEIWPRQTPVASVVTLRQFDGSTVAIVPEDAFGVPTSGDSFAIERSGSYAHDTRIVARSGGNRSSFVAGQGNVELTYMAGRSVTTASVDPLISSTAGMVLRRLWRREAGSWTQSPDYYEASDTTLGTGFYKVVDAVVSEFLAHELKPPGSA